jgi:hypothetical protein
VNLFEDFVDGAIAAASITLFLLMMWSFWSFGGGKFLLNGGSNAPVQSGEGSGVMDAGPVPEQLHGI